jgi:hypothetical protein
MLKKLIFIILNKFDFLINQLSITQAVFDNTLLKIIELETQNQKNPLNKFGYKLFSQSDEDGILNEILKRIQIPKQKIFIEIGVGNLTENNSLNLLLSKGWKGVWFDLKFPRWWKEWFEISRLKNIYFKEIFVKRDNIINLIDESFNFFNLNNKRINVLSVDIDSDEYGLINNIIQFYEIDVIISEYNSKYGPSSIFTHSENDLWDGTAYQGSSIKALRNILDSKYCLVGYSISGVNVFFVNKKYKNLFLNEIDNVNWMQPRYYLTNVNSGHRVSDKLVKKIILENESN